MTDPSHTHLSRTSSDPQVDNSLPSHHQVQPLVDEKQNYAKLFVDPGDMESHRAGGEDYIIINGVEMLAKRRQRRRSRLASISGPSRDTPPIGGKFSLPIMETPANKSGGLTRTSDDSNHLLVPGRETSSSLGRFSIGGEEAASSDRLRQLLIGDDDDSHGALFCELQELHDSEWHEKARWVRFEEDVEEGGGRWSKPFVATLALHALFELRHSISQGAILLDINPSCYSEFVGLVADALVEANLLEPSQRNDFIITLHYRHVHQHEHGSHSIRRGLSEIGKKLSSHDTMSTHLASGLGASAAIVGGIAGLPSLSVPSTGSNIPALVREESVHKPNEHFAKKLASGTEASSSMVGAVEYLTQTLAAFVRLSNDNLVLDSLTEVAVPCRFVFILLGPTSKAKDVHEIGRAMSTIMSDDIFRDVAYRSADRADILAGLDEFLDEVTVLPPGEWDPSIRIQPPKSVPTQEERKLNALNQIAEESTDKDKNSLQRNASSSGAMQGGLIMKAPVLTVGEENEPLENTDNTSRHITPAVSGVDVKTKPGDSEEPPQDEGPPPGGHGVDPDLLRTGRIYGGLVADIKRKAVWAASDFTDALTPQCVASVFYLFFACLAPIVTFGGLLGNATDNNMAAFETILSGAICGTTFHLFSGQPITIIGSTGPVLVFEKIVFRFTNEYGFSYLTARFWIGIYAACILMAIVAFDLSAMVQLITRFTEECFATLISVIFIFESFVALYGVYKANPISTEANIAKNYSCWCEFSAGNGLGNGSTIAPFVDCQSLEVWNCSSTDNCQVMGPGCSLTEPVPDVFFFSCLIFFGTCFLAFALKDFRTTPFFPNKCRCLISDFSVSISIFVMIGIDFFVGLPTPKLKVPEEFAPTRSDRGWIVNPWANPLWTIAVAPLPAFLLSVLLFLDQQITAVIVNRREHKLKKGKGYHLDLFVLTMHVTICATFGLPYYVAATVLSITHVNSLRKQSETAAPGEQPKFLGLIEQRVTGLVVFILIGCAIPLRAILNYIPMPVLYGVFLYMGLAALQTSQFYSRVLLFFMPVKYQPDAPYLRHMKTWRVHLFTAIQLAAFMGLWIIKQFKSISILFILMLVIMVIVRRLLDFVFTQDELRWVDDILPKNPLAVPKKTERQQSQLSTNSTSKDKDSGNQLRQRSIGSGSEAEKQPMV